MSDKDVQRLTNNLDFVLSDQRPRDVAASNLPGAPQITTRGQLASHVGVSSHSNLSGKAKLSDPIEAHLQRIYDMPHSSDVWKAFANGERHELKRLYYERHPETPSQPNEAPILASLELYIQQVPEGEPSPIGFALICSPVPIEGIHGVAVKQGIMTLQCEKAVLPRLNERAGFGEVVTSKSGDVVRRISVHQDQGSGRLAWRIEAIDGAIGPLVSDEKFKFKIASKEGEAEREITDALCRLAGLEPGSVVSAAFRVYVKDLVETEPLKEAPQQTSYSFLDTSSAPLSREARAIIHRATLAMSVNETKNGWVNAAIAKEIYEDKT